MCVLRVCADEILNDLLFSPLLCIPHDHNHDKHDNVLNNEFEKVVQNMI